LNLGCGSRFHPDWENIDMHPYGAGVRVHDLTKRTPYGDETFDVVYHSHVLEHFPKKQALSFLQECRRILKSGGVVRVVVPDLERIARLYIEALEKASNGVPGWAENYEWMVMEMYDQTVREESSGGVTEYFSRNSIPNRDFILLRWGAFAVPYMSKSQGSAISRQGVSPQAKTAWAYVFRNPGKVLRSKLLKLLMGEKDWEALRIGRFRRTGEVHMWMYDFYSLGKLLESAGFNNARRVGPTESRIPNWSSFHLDTEPDGQVYKADSMYMEAVKS
jgi:predicted SAM-dependent methyltransferase